MPKRFRRKTKKTILLYCEGKTDEVFCKYLKSLFNTNKKKAVKIRGGKGGSPVDIVMNAHKTAGDFETRAVFLDSDKTKAELKKARDLAKKRKILLIEANPCLEMLLLQILDADLKKVKKTSASLKKILEKRYLKQSKAFHKNPYEDVLTKERIQKKEKYLPTLKKLVKIIKD